MDNEYNGWTNYETWNVALWIGNTEHLYNAACHYMKRQWRDEDYYKNFINGYMEESSATDDGVKWLDHKLDYDELDEFMKELIA